MSVFLEAVAVLSSGDHAHKLPLPLIKCALTNEEGTDLLQELHASLKVSGGYTE